MPDEPLPTPLPGFGDPKAEPRHARLADRVTDPSGVEWEITGLDSAGGEIYLRAVRDGKELLKLVRPHDPNKRVSVPDGWRISKRRPVSEEQWGS